MYLDVSDSSLVVRLVIKLALPSLPPPLNIALINDLKHLHDEVQLRMFASSLKSMSETPSRAYPPPLSHTLRLAFSHRPASTSYPFIVLTDRILLT